MSIKVIRDRLEKIVTRGNSSNDQLGEFFDYFQRYGAIKFNYKVSRADKAIIAYSTNFRLGSIVTSGRNPQEIDQNIKDAILTAFDIPSVYLEETRLMKVGDEKVARYALA